jgi:hypothetical protein
MYMQPGSKTSRTCGSPTRHPPAIRPSSATFAITSAIALSLLSGCAGQPRLLEAQCPRPNPDLMEPVPPPLYFQMTLECILQKAQGQTLDQTCEDLLRSLTE